MCKMINFAAMETIADRLNSLGAGMPRGWRKSLAKHCGVNPVSVSDWLSGKSKSIEGKNLLKAAEFLQVNPQWLATGKGVKDNTSAPSVSEAPSVRDPIESDLSVLEPLLAAKYRHALEGIKLDIRIAAQAARTKVETDRERTTLDPPLERRRISN